MVSGNRESVETIRKRYETRASGTLPVPSKTLSNSNIQGLINETHTIINNYETEVEFLRNKLQESETDYNSFKDISISDSMKVEYEPCAKITFFNHMKFFSDKDPGIAEIANAYNDKITELFIENDTLQSNIKKDKTTEEELIAANKKIVTLEHNISEKNQQIQNTNDIYAEKFSETFQKITELMAELETVNRQKSKADDINNLLKASLVKLENDNKELQTANKDLSSKIEQGKQNNSEKIVLLEADIVALKLSKKKLEDEVSQLNKEISNKNSEIEKVLIENINSTEELKKQHSQNFDDINATLNEKIEKLEKQNNDSTAEILILQQSIQSASKDTQDRNLIIQDKLQVEQKLKELEEEFNDLNTKYIRKDTKIKTINEENDNLREIIAKDQIRLKELKEYKETTEVNITSNNTANELIIEENKLLKTEAELIKKKLEDSTKENTTLTETNSTNTVKIEEQTAQISEYKERLKELEGSIQNFAKNTMVERSQTGQLKMSSTPVITTTFQQFALTKELMIDYLFYLYLYDNSINLHQIADVLLNNYSLYMDSVFLAKDEYRSPFSPMHELLEDIHLLIYSTCVKKKEMYKHGEIKNDMWCITSDDITQEVIDEVTKIIEDSNIIDLYLRTLKKIDRSLDDIFEIFINNYEKSFNFEAEKSFREYIKTEICPTVIEKIENYKKSLIGQLSSIIKYSISNFNSGKVIYNGKVVYDFKQFFLEMLSRRGGGNNSGNSSNSRSFISRSSCSSNTSMNSEIVDGNANSNTDKDANNLKTDTTSIALNQNSSTNNTLRITETLLLTQAVDSVAICLKTNCKNLTKIYFNNSFNHNTQNAIGKLFLSMILYTPTLTTLSITNCQFTEHQLTYITKLIESLKLLNHLDLSGNQLSDDGTKIIAECLKSNRTISSVFLNNNSINSNGGFYLADTLMKNISIKRLSLMKNNINESGLSSLLTVIVNNNKKIKYLDISDNNLISEDFQNIGEFINSNTSVRVLNLSNNLIDSPSAHYLGVALKSSNSLSVLYLKNTSLNEESVPLLLKNLPCSELCEIYLDENPLGEIGTILIANAIKMNCKTKYISLRNCQVSTLSVSVLAKNIENNNYIEGINLEGNSFDEVSIGVIMKAVRNRNVKIYLTAGKLNAKAREIVKAVVSNFVLN